MNARGRNGPFFIKTYSKQMRKVEPWFSPKAVFSLSSTASSDQSISDSTRPKKRRMKTTSSRPAKRKALIALKEKESDEENCAPSPPSSSFRRKTNAKPSVKTTAAIKTRTKKKKKRNIQSILSSSENEDDSFMMKKSHPKTSEKECTNVNKVLDPPLLSRFVTHRKRPPAPTQAQKHTSKPNSVALHHTLNSSDDFHPSFSRNKHLASRKTITQHRYSNNPVTHKNCKLSQLRVALGEVSFNDSDDQNLPCKRPLLSSTPSLVCRPLQRLPEPSISEISSLSCDELCQPAKINISALGLRNIKSSDPTSQEESRQQLSKQTGERGMEQREAVEETAGEGERDQRTGECAGGVSSPSHTGPPSPLQSLAEQLKERCCTVAVSVMLNRINISDHLSEQNCSRKQEEEMLSNYVESSVTRADHSNQTHASVSSSFHSLTKPSLTSKRLSTSSITEPSCSVQVLIDRLKAECLLSCLTVGVPRLDFGACPAVHQGAAKASCTDSPNHRDASTRCSDSSDRSPINLRAPNTNMVVRRLSASFQPSLASPPASAAPSKTRPPAAGKERTGAGTSTGRKVCVSGLNVSRWTKRDTGEFNAKRRKKEGQMKGVSGDYSSWSSLMSAGADAHAGDSVCGWLQGGSGFGLAVTPLRMEQMNLSSILANFTPDTLTTHSWGRLKAALSLHKKKTAFPTPRRLVQSPGSRFPADSSLDLFASPVRTSLCRLTPSRLLRSAINTPRTVYEDDISDAEKVYQECQQNGPLSFSDCIPPSRMKLCSKIGEGTFGEVFSTVNDSNQTVALKIIPVEGSQRVNGEQQKSFGEILHEIIISKELSSLNLKDINKSDGFIGLNDLHCVRGRYPEALLKAWDKFDRQKGSENDRPDFFDDEQLFLILEFEFGGSDLENMNGKLSSMAQAISVLHQVTAALAVAEQELHFEHRDLHWGNILVNNTKQKQCEFILNGELHSIETRGVHVNIIDYSLSRLEIDGLTVSCDISADDELFMGQGDYQFEIYRLMKKENNNCWATYNPHSNVLWLHYLADKLMSMSYRAKAQSSQQRTLKSSLKSFQSEILNYASATDALRNCRFFQ